MSKQNTKLKRCNKLLKKNKISQLNDFKLQLKTNSSTTVFRFLKHVDYYSSCSHSGQYYTSISTPDFNELGLWFYNSILFSSHGNLYETLEYIISNSERGYSSFELGEILNLTPNLGLLKLIKENKVFRKKESGVFIYYSGDKLVREKQELFYKINEEKIRLISPNVFSDELKGSMILFYCTLNEKQRRLYAGVESIKIGKNGDPFIADLLQLNIKTVAKGRHELLENSIIEGVRNERGGRKKKG